MSIAFLKDRFVLNTKNTSYVILLRSCTFDGTTETVTAVCNGYWGERLLHPEEVPNNYFAANGSSAYIEKPLQCQEYPAYGAKFFNAESLKVRFADGVRDLRLSYKDYKIAEDGHLLTLTLKDIYYPFEVDLCYRIFEGLDLIDRWTVLRNLGPDPAELETFYSANFTVPYSENLRLTHFSSAWGDEYRLQQQPLLQSPVLLESRAGVSNATAYPYFAVDQNATEHSGAVWFGTLQWSGNWQIKAGRDHNRWPQICGGISNYNTAYTLNGGQSFQTPVFTGGFVTGGFGAATRQLHGYQRQTSKTPWTNRVMPVMYNAWASFYFNLDEAMLMAQAERCQKLGVELFMIDDGWFKNRNNDLAGLGDWEVDPEKFPNGLTPLINKVESLGMIFGIWVEPEMVSEESELYQEHPEWILRYPTRQPVKKRHQYVLNFGLPEVYEFTVAWLDKLLRKNHIQYLKWDMNRFLSEVNWNGLTNTPDDAVYIKYVQNLYRVLEYINQNYPEVLIENCASGGLRADLSMAKWCGRINRSDNQDCLDALVMHEGFTRVNLTKAAGGGCHLHHTRYVTMSGRYEALKRMAYTGLLGSFSVGLDLRKLNKQQLSEVAGYIALYKRLRETVQLGNMYLLRSVNDPTAPAVIYQFVSQDKKQSVVFIYNNNKGFMGWLEAFKLYGLEPETVYNIEMAGDDANRTHVDFAPLSGDTLMKFGVSFKDKRLLCDDSVYGCLALILTAK